MCEKDTAGREQAWQLSWHGLHWPLAVGPLVLPVNRRSTAVAHIYKENSRRVFIGSADGIYAFSSEFFCAFSPKFHLF